MESHHLVILSLVQFRFGHPNQLISCISFIFSSVINCSFPVISPCKHCFQFRYSGGLACVSLSPAVVSDCLCLHSRSLTIRLWSAAHHRECHYDSARFQKRKVMAELLVGFQGALIGCQGSTKEHSKTSSDY